MVSDPVLQRPGRRLLLCYRVPVKIQKFSERKGEYLDLNIPARKIGGQFRRKQICIRTGDVNITIKIHTERVDRVFPSRDPLHLIKEQIHPFIGQNTGFHIFVKTSDIHVWKTHGLKVHFQNLFLCNTILTQVLGHQLHKAGFSATPDASNDLDHLRVLKRNHPIQIEITLFQSKFLHCSTTFNASIS